MQQPTGNNSPLKTQLNRNFSSPSINSALLAAAPSIITVPSTPPAPAPAPLTPLPRSSTPDIHMLERTQRLSQPENPAPTIVLPNANTPRYKNRSSTSPSSEQIAWVEQQTQQLKQEREQLQREKERLLADRTALEAQRRQFIDNSLLFQVQQQTLINNQVLLAQEKAMLDAKKLTELKQKLEPEKKPEIEEKIDNSVKEESPKLQSNGCCSKLTQWCYSKKQDNKITTTTAKRPSSRGYERVPMRQ